MTHMRLCNLIHGSLEIPKYMIIIQNVQFHNNNVKGTTNLFIPFTRTAHNSIFNYDLISVCETNLDDSVELPETLLKDFAFVPANHHLNIKHGGVGLFYKNSLPVNVRRDLSFDESSG